jgi:hypothetical protein
MLAKVDMAESSEQMLAYCWLQGANVSTRAVRNMSLILEAVTLPHLRSSKC